MKFKPGDKVAVMYLSNLQKPARYGTVISCDYGVNDYFVKFNDGEERYVDGDRLSPVVKICRKPVKQAPPRPGRLEVMQAAIDHNGVPYQMVKVNEELSELAKEICKYLIGKGDIDHITEEMGDVYIVLGELQLMLNISTQEIGQWESKKLDRLWEEINNEKGKA